MPNPDLRSAQQNPWDTSIQMDDRNAKWEDSVLISEKEHTTKPGGGPAQLRTPHVPPPTGGGDARIEKK